MDYSAKANSAFVYYEFKSNMGLANSNSRISIKETRVGTCETQAIFLNFPTTVSLLFPHHWFLAML